MKKRIQVISSERREAVYEGGRKSVSFICQCVLLEDAEVGVMRVPLAKCEKYLDEQGNLPTGVYELLYVAGIDWQKREIRGELHTFEKLNVKSDPVGIGAAAKEAKA